MSKSPETNQKVSIQDKDTSGVTTEKGQEVPTSNKNTIGEDKSENRHKLVSSMDSSDESLKDEEKADRNPVKPVNRLEDKSFLASYVFIELGNSILQSPEIRKEYYQRKNALVNNLRSNLKEKGLKKEGFEPER